MKSASFGVFLVFFCLAVAAAQTNYLLNSYESSLSLKEAYDTEMNFFRERLMWQADDFSYYFTVRMRTALERATTPAQGAALQFCAAQTATRCQESINRFDDSLRNLQDDANKLHLSVYEQLRETNIKKVNLELFYYYHRYRLEEAEYKLENVHVMELGGRWLEMWVEYFVFAEELDECIAAALE